jgi:hypothetical protein
VAAVSDPSDEWHEFYAAEAAYFKALDDFRADAARIELRLQMIEGRDALSIDDQIEIHRQRLKLDSVLMEIAIATAIRAAIVKLPEAEWTREGMYAAAEAVATETREPFVQSMGGHLFAIQQLMLEKRQ